MVVTLDCNVAWSYKHYNLSLIFKIRMQLRTLTGTHLYLQLILARCVDLVSDMLCANFNNDWLNILINVKHFLGEVTGNVLYMNVHL